MVSPLPRATFWVVVLLLLAGSLATLGGATAASSSSYALTGFAQTANGQGPSGMLVDLQSRATGQIFTATTYGTAGAFTFNASNTGGTLAPGYWSVWIPAQTNSSSFGGCSTTYPCGIFPVNQNPTTRFFSASNLTNNTAPVSLGITAVSYTATIKGTVSEAGTPVANALVQLFDPQFNDLSLVNNTTGPYGNFSLKAPPGTWVVKTTVSGFPNAYNVTQVVVPKRGTVPVSPNVENYLIYGSVLKAQGHAPVPNGGNMTVWDPTNKYIYSEPTSAGGYYSFGSYANLSYSGSQTFDVVLSTIGYATNYSSVTVSSPTSIQKNIYVTPLQTNQRGSYSTLLNFTTINTTSGKGTVGVSTSAYLGNNTVFSNLPNVTIGQMWAQLGLDFSHSITFPQADLSAFYAWENASGPFFPAVQAGLAINGTTFKTPTSAQNLSSFSATSCAAGCSLSTPGDIQLGWNSSYTLNGTLAGNSSSYTISFGFTHPLSSDAYNYTVVLPQGYALSAGTAAPSNTKLLPLGPDNTWTKFDLVSLPSPTPQGSATFTIIKYSNLTANVNITEKNFAFSTANILNSTHNYYSVIVGINQNVTFSALNSTYPAGTNGTKFVWNFGDSSPIVTTGQATTNHTYTAASGRYADNGSLTITSSGGLVNSTTFYVWVGAGPTTAVISTNATSSQNRTSGTAKYVFVNWGYTLTLNASASIVNISATAMRKNIVAVSYFVVTAKGFKVTNNYTASAGQNASGPWSYTFLGAGVYYSNGTTIGGARVAFKGWQYNITLTVWSGSGQSGSSTLIVLVNDTEKPTPSFQVINAAGKPVSSANPGVITAANLTARIALNATNATDPHNGSLVKYYWQISNSGNSSVYRAVNVTTVKPYPVFWLTPQTKSYTINLTVTDLNGNKAWTTSSLSVSVNSTTTPIMEAENLTAPSSYTAGTSYTIWVNITSGGGTSSTAQNVTVVFYLTSPTGTTRTYIASTPGSVQFYNYSSSAVVNSTPFATGLIVSMAYNSTYRAEIHWTPSSTGNFVLYANVTATNGYIGNYASGVVSQSISVSPSALTQALEYGLIIVVIAVVVVGLIFWYRRRGRASSSGKSSGRSKSKPAADEDDELDDDN